MNERSLPTTGDLDEDALCHQAEPGSGHWDLVVAPP